MIRITSLALLALATIAAHTSYLNNQHNGTQTTEGIEMIGGNEAEVGKHLYVTGLRVSDADVNYCAGSLISPTAVLTSASCAYYNSPTSVSVGSHYSESSADGERIKVKTIVVHPKFSTETMAYDYAILELETPTTISPVEIWFEDDAATAPGVMGVARGWGFASSDSEMPKVLKEVGLKIWSNKDCQAALGERSKLPVDIAKVCAGGVRGEGPCDGDLGGPLTVSKDGKDVLVAHLSWGVACAKDGLPSVYNRLSSAKDFLAPYLPKPAC
ncbi:hypothetical protein SPRG_13831 [Saprolegnia parasitica CBS 223.65]|uniref:Peptidase S1 domain-containing protein n=1 Tax=Saprolegnia parasitica (strain CBS 223.65) TaxID=695850 RepID=A0A067C3A3_SAPPC|nr:hypothetical protein SPRG_13831 [Saprolegnia parasitica CBS 223.65]KDO21041.1 hypothetical protein SPRG_13831 [Saprolegnia parasitica CBS 223.65]|eukprot:XP_012208222.1 hypothetical protein SPRG_13831 [Saprolegnia parasitica CBS 223.65]